jgi:hypothetical protein
MVAVGGGFAAVAGGQHIGQAVQCPLGQVVDQRGIGLQLEAKARETLHQFKHQLLVQRGLAAVKGDIDFLALQDRCLGVHSAAVGAPAGGVLGTQRQGCHRLRAPILSAGRVKICRHHAISPIPSTVNSLCLI